MVGYECVGASTASGLFCGYITEQIPPSYYTWEYNFFITPLIDHTKIHVGYVLKVLLCYNNTKWTP